MMNQNSQQEMERRVEKLIKKMSLSQKIAQLSGMTIEKGVTTFRQTSGLGTIAFLVTEETPEEFRKRCIEFSEKIRMQTPWKIQPLVHSEALCGPMMKEHVVFPAPLGMGASFDPQICFRMGERIRHSLSYCGVRQALAPVLDLARDFRWGRTGETYGGDPTLVSIMGCAWIQGLQGKDLTQGVLATGKHFLGYSTPEGGLNSAQVVADRRDFREHLAKPFEAAIREAGLRCVMAAYGEMEGVPLCANEMLLTKLLREELDFDGFVVSDYMALQMMQQSMGFLESPGEIGTRCLEAGLDMELPEPFAFSAELRELVKFGVVPEAWIDRALGRILKCKLELGLLDPPPEVAKISEEERRRLGEENDLLSEKAAEESMVLLKNKGLLPLKKGTKVALIGPCADSLRKLHNGYTWAAVLDVLLGSGKEDSQQLGDLFQQFGGTSKADAHVEQEVDAQIRREHPMARTIKEALEEAGVLLTYTKGTNLEDGAEEEIQKAVELAKHADLVVLSLGGKVGWDGDCTGGEGIDNVSADLPWIQQKLFQKIREVNDQVVVLHTDGKPLICQNIYENAGAILEAWLPGPMGGNAIANVLCGKTCPGGKLPVDVPRHSGQMPIYYYKRKSAILGKGYRGCEETAQLPFGYGLSYTTFQKEMPIWSVEKEGLIPELKVRVTVTNTGNVPGAEVIQLYGWDPVASVVRPRRELLGFRRIELKPGEQKTVCFRMALDLLSFPDALGRWKLEAGSFVFSIAEHGEDPGKQYTYELPRTIEVDQKKRCLFAETFLA